MGWRHLRAVTIWRKGQVSRLSSLQRSIFNSFSKFLVLHDINRPVFNCFARRIFAQVVIIFAIDAWADGARDKGAAAIRAHMTKKVFNTTFAERAFERTDHGLG